MGNYSLCFSANFTDSTCNRRRCPLYLPQDSLGTTAEQKGIIHPDQHLALPSSEAVYPFVTSDTNTLGAAVSMKTPREISQRVSLHSFEDLEDYTNLSPSGKAVKYPALQQAWSGYGARHVQGIQTKPRRGQFQLPAPSKRVSKTQPE